MTGAAIAAIATGVAAFVLAPGKKQHAAAVESTDSARAVRHQ